MSNMIWNIIFSALLTIFLFALGWFIRLLIVFKNDIKDIEDRVSKLEEKQAVDDERWRRMEKWMDQIDKKIDRLVVGKQDKEEL